MAYMPQGLARVTLSVMVRSLDQMRGKEGALFLILVATLLVWFMLLLPMAMAIRNVKTESTGTTCHTENGVVICYPNVGSPNPNVPLPSKPPPPP